MSSSPNSSQNSFDSHEPRPELESPFLNEEYLTEEARTAPTWRTPVPGFQLESPFLQAFEEGWGASDESEVEELYSEANYPESNEFDDREVSNKPTADAFVVDNDGKRYFEIFPQLGNLIVKKVTILTPSNFENLMNLMLASSQKNFVIDAHGEPKGLFMPLAEGTKIAATKHSLFILRGIEHIRFLIRTAEESETIWGRASGTDVDSWRKILEVLHSKIWQQMMGAGWPTIIPKITSVDEAKKIVQSRINSLVDSLFPGKVTNKQDQVDRLIKKMMRLQAKGIREIQFRACNIGKDSNTLHEFQKFFGTDHLCAPDVRSGMGSANPRIDRQSVDRLGQDNQTQVFNMPNGRFAIRIIITGVTFTVNCAAETQAAVREWVANHIMANSTYQKGVLPIHFLETQPPVFPLDNNYTAHIKCHSSFWESIVRGSEKHRQEIEAYEEREEKWAIAEPEFEEFEEFFDESDEEDFSITPEWKNLSEEEAKYEQIGEFETFGYLEPEAFDEEHGLDEWMPSVDQAELFEFDISSTPSQVIIDALSKKDWELALKLAIQEGWRDKNHLTNLLFFAQHPELPKETLDPNNPKFKQLSAEWAEILKKEVWKAIEISAKNTDLVVSGKEVIDHHRRFFQGKSGKRLKQLVEDAAKEVDLNPGLLGTIMMAETRRPQSYLSSEKVSSYHIGADDFFEGRAAIKARVPAYAKLKWDKNQTPLEHDNDSKACRKKAAAKAAGDNVAFDKYSKLCRKVKTIQFDSGSDAVLATAVYTKFREVIFREIAAELKGDFDNLPLATRLALARMAMASGTAGATPFLKDALKGEDIFIRKAIPVKKAETKEQTQRNATVRTAQAIHLSDWIFGIPVVTPTAQPEIELFENFDQESPGFYDSETELGWSEVGEQDLDREFLLEAMSEASVQDETFDPEALDQELEWAEEWEPGEHEIEEFADLEDELLLEFEESETSHLMPEEETGKGLSKKLKFLSLLPHTIEMNGKDIPLTPNVMDPSIYDGPEKYKIAPKLQECLMGVMSTAKFRHIKVALVDLTKDATKPEFAAFNHKSQVFAASVPKIAAMLAAFQLRQDLRIALKQKGSTTLDDLYSKVHDDWAATQIDLKGKDTPFQIGISLRGKLVLVQGEKIAFSEPKAPQLEKVFANVPIGNPVTIEFKSTGESKAQLETMIENFNKSKRGAKQKLDALGFLERMRIMVGGLVPASNYATSTIVRDVGFLYIASTLLQSGLYNTDRQGGLWLGADYWGKTWKGTLGGGSAQSATAGSLAAFMTLLGQNRLVSSQASVEMGSLMKKEPNPTHPGIVSWFKEGLKGLKDDGSLRLVLSKLGAHSGVDDCTFIEREVDLGISKKVLRYVAVGLRARSAKELKSLILELDKCILDNNGLTPAQGGHS